MLRNALLQQTLRVGHLLSLDRDVGGLTLNTAEGLMHHDPGVRQRIALARCAGTQQELAHRGAESHTDGADLGLNKLHGVVDRHAGGDRATRAVDVQPNRLLCVLPLEVEQLGGDVVGDAVVDVGAEDDDPFLEETIEDVGLRRAEGRRFGMLGDDVVDLGHKPEGYRGDAPNSCSGRPGVGRDISRRTRHRSSSERSGQRGSVEARPEVDQRARSRCRSADHPPVPLTGETDNGAPEVAGGRRR